MQSMCTAHACLCVHLRRIQVVSCVDSHQRSACYLVWLQHWYAYSGCHSTCIIALTVNPVGPIDQEQLACMQIPLHMMVGQIA